MSNSILEKKMTTICMKCGKETPAGSSTCASCSPENGSDESLRKPMNEHLSANVESTGDIILAHVGCFVFRTFISIMIWTIIGALAILSGLPYGGGDEVLFRIWQLATLFLPIWMIGGLITGPEKKPVPKPENASTNEAGN